MPTLLTICLAIPACRDSSATHPAQPVAVIVSGDTRGAIVPGGCGCGPNQSGGLLRRGSYVEETRRSAEVVVADVGGAPAGTNEYQKAKFEAILQGEMTMGLAAHNLGGPEVEFGAEYLRSIGRKLRVPFVSANLVDAGGRPVAEPAIVVTAGGRRIMFIGVVSPRFAIEGLRINDPKQAVLQTLAANKAHDGVIVLAYLPEEELRVLAEGLPEVSAVIGGPTGQSITPRRVGPTLLTSATNRGRFVAHVSVEGQGKGSTCEARIVEIKDPLPEEARQQENLRQLQKVLAERDFSAEQSGLVPVLPKGLPEEYRIAGAGACRDCHVEVFQAWSESKHSRAWQTLVKLGQQIDPYCQQCHTEGYGQNGGFMSPAASPDRTSVGCEDCHGPSLGHCRDSTTTTTFQAADQCRRCHDFENSPNFEYEAYWAKMRHGKSPASGPADAEGEPSRTEVTP